MAKEIVAAAAAAVLASLSAMHVYWAAGGRRGAGVAVPEVAGRQAFSPGPLATVVVALLLATAAALVWWRGGWWSPGGVPRAVPTVGTFGVAAVLALRTVGDFRLFGVFKKVRGTRFARWDSLLFTPLAAALAAACAFVALSA